METITINKTAKMTLHYAQMTFGIVWNENDGNNHGEAARALYFNIDDVDLDYLEAAFVAYRLVYDYEGTLENVGAMALWRAAERLAERNSLDMLATYGALCKFCKEVENDPPRDTDK